MLRQGSLGVFVVVVGFVAAAACNNPAVVPDVPQASIGGSARSGPDLAAIDSEVGSFLTADAGGGTAPAPAPSGPRLRGTPCAEGAAAREGSCDGTLAGMYAIQVNLDVYWQDETNIVSPVFDPGRGDLQILLSSSMSDLCPGESPGETILRVCDVRFPTLYADSNGGALQFIVPASIWDRPGMPVFISAARAVEPPGSVVFDPVLSTLGIELHEVDARWPSSDETPFVTCSNGGFGAECFMDQDADGHPGISIYLRTSGRVSAPPYPRRGGWLYTPAPSDPSLPILGRGAKILYAGMRAMLAGSLPVGTDCNGGERRAEVGDVSLRVVDCVLDDGTACSPRDASYVDRSMPEFHRLNENEAPPATWKHRRAGADEKLRRSPSEGSTYTVVRLGDLDADLSCADVREAFGVETP